MSNLVCKETIHVPTQHGPCTVDLMLGDITTLQHSQAVDFILVSAFPGDYTIVPGTLIGALHKQLGISVRMLSQDKELDLRKHFSIWMSKPLVAVADRSPHPFKRLICFERWKQAHPATFVGDIFRGLMPIVHNQDTTIITPLLATGNQNFSLSVMMSAMVSSACNWMKVGLPLRCLKIVLYTQNTSRLSNEQKELIDLFVSLKAKWGGTPLSRKQTLLYDIYLSYDPSDSQLVGQITESLKKASSTVKVFSDHQEIVSTSSWQEEMFTTMNSCKRIVVVLTCAFMESKECLEQFNIGMCCSRVRGYEMLAPLKLQEIPNMPSYIMLVQYIDCSRTGLVAKLAPKDRFGKEQENRITSTNQSLDHVLTAACTKIVSSLSAPPVKSSNKYNYDVFISYSHQKPAPAKEMIKLFEQHKTSIKVFYDVSELETGYSWQKSLYTCIDNCRCMMAFICDEYLASPICVEELSIAAARAMTQSDFYLVTVCIADLTDPPSWLSGLHLIDGRPTHYANVSKTVCSTICSYLGKDSTTLQKIHLDDSVFRDKCIAERLKQVQTTFVVGKVGLVSMSGTNDSPPSEPQQLHANTVTETNTDTDSGQCDVYFCYSQDDITYAAILGHMIGGYYRDVATSYGHESQSQRRRKLDIADVIVVFISQKLIESTQLMDELHHALLRARHHRKKLVYLLQSSDIPAKPTFVHILPCDVNLTDAFWSKFAAKMVVKHSKFVLQGELHGSYSCEPMRVLGLQKAAADIANLLKPHETSDKQSSNHGVFINVLDDGDSVVTTMDELLSATNEQKPPPANGKVTPKDLATQEVPEGAVITAQEPGLPNPLETKNSEDTLLEARSKDKSNSCVIL